MSGALIAVIILLLIFAAYAHRRPGTPHRDAAREGWDQLRPLLPRLPVALAAAAFISVLIPEEAVINLLGEASGWRGILTASIIGGFLPGGPIVAFPMIVVFLDSHAGTAQVIALLTSWSVLAFHRVAVFELPLLGARYTVIRLISSVPLPVIAGFSAGILVHLIRG